MSNHRSGESRGARQLMGASLPERGAKGRPEKAQARCLVAHYLPRRHVGAGGSLPVLHSGMPDPG